MLTPLDHFYLSQPEPTRSCLMALKEIILHFDLQVTEEWKYRLPFFYYNGKMFCYLWIEKKSRQPYIGIVKGGMIEHPSLIQEKRAKMKVMFIDPALDLPVEQIQSVLTLARQFY